MDDYLVYKRQAPRCMQHAAFLSSFLLVVTSAEGIMVYDMRLSFFAYYSARAKALDMMRSAEGAASAAIACCSGTCTNTRAAEQQQQQGCSASSSGSRLLRKRGSSSLSADLSDQQEKESNKLISSGGGKDGDLPLRCLPVLFLGCLQRDAAEHEKMQAKLSGKSASFFSRIVTGVQTGKAEASSAINGNGAPAEKKMSREHRRERSGFEAEEEDLLHVPRDRHGKDGEEPCSGKGRKYRGELLDPSNKDCHAFFLFESTPLAFRVCDAFFRFCSLLMQHQRLQNQRSSLCGDDAPINSAQKPPSPCTRKPLVSYRSLKVQAL